MRVVIADDEALLREGLARLLEDAGFEVVGTLRRRRALLRMVDARRPDVAIVDIRMPPAIPTTACSPRRRSAARHPEIGVLVLSHHLESRYAMRLLEEAPSGPATCSRNASPTSRCSPTRSADRRGRMRRRPDDRLAAGRPQARARPLDELTDREREVLALIAEGHSNRAICDRLFLRPKTVEAHVSRSS